MVTERMKLSYHARQRIAQRNLSVDDLRVVCELGAREHRAGLVCYFLGQRTIARLDKSREYERLNGVTVLCCPRCGTVVTAYHNPRGLRDYRRKSKYNTQGAGACCALA